MLSFYASLESVDECDIVGVFDVARIRKPLGEPGEFDVLSGDILLDIEIGRFTFYIWVGRDDDLPYLGRIPDAVEEFCEVQGIGHTAVDRGDGTPEDVVVPVEYPEPLNGEHIQIVLHHTEYMTLAGLIRADSTDSPIPVREPETGLAVVHICLEFLQFPCEVSDIRTVRFQ